jgi:hypothetical protein
LLGKAFAIFLLENNVSIDNRLLPVVNKMLTTTKMHDYNLVINTIYCQ